MSNKVVYENTQYAHTPTHIITKASILCPKVMTHIFKVIKFNIITGFVYLTKFIVINFIYYYLHTVILCC